MLKNPTVHAEASVNMKDEAWNNDFDAPHDALYDDIDINNWSDVEETAIAHDTCMDQDTDSSDGRDAVESKENDVVDSEQCFQEKDDDSAFVKDDDSTVVRDDDSASVKDDDSAILSDDDSAFVRDDSKSPNPSSSWTQPPTKIKVEKRSTDDKKPSPREMTMKPSEEEQGEMLSDCEYI
jgi:hypothetical protein